MLKLFATFLLIIFGIWIIVEFVCWIYTLLLTYWPILLLAAALVAAS